MDAAARAHAGRRERVYVTRVTLLDAPGKGGQGFESVLKMLETIKAKVAVTRSSHEHEPLMLYHAGCTESRRVENSSTRRIQSLQPTDHIAEPVNSHNM